MDGWMVTKQSNMEVVIGTYDQSLCALRLCPGDGEHTYKFEATFSDHGHGGCVKAVACAGQFLASGSTDETIRLFNLKQRVELGRLNQQEGSITSLDFCNNSHMLSGSEDGTICVWECKTWDCLKVLKGHREAVTSLSVHPSGRLALSVSKDKSLRTWNLLTGRSAYITNIKQVADIVLWSPSGETYAVVTRTQVIVYKVSTAASVYTIKVTKAVLSLTFIDDDFIALGGEKCDIEIHDVTQERCVQSLSGHQTRIKGLTSVKHQDDSGEINVFLFSVSSDGLLIAWSFQNGKYDSPPDLLCQFELDVRPTCIAVSAERAKISHGSKLLEKEDITPKEVKPREKNERKHNKNDSDCPVKSEKNKSNKRKKTKVS